MPNLENEVEKPVANEQSSEKFTNEAVHEAFSKGSEGSYKVGGSGKASESANKALPGLELVGSGSTDSNNSNSDSSNSDSGKTEMHMNGMQGGKGSQQAMDHLEELRKDPNGNGGGEMKSDKNSGPAGGNSRGGKFEQGTNQSGRGESGGGPGVESAKTAAPKEAGPAPKAVAKETEPKVAPKAVEKVINNPAYRHQ